MITKHSFILRGSCFCEKYIFTSICSISWQLTYNVTSGVMITFPDGTKWGHCTTWDVDRVSFDKFRQSELKAKFVTTPPVKRTGFNHFTPLSRNIKWHSYRSAHEDLMKHVPLKNSIYYYE